MTPSLGFGVSSGAEHMLSGGQRTRHIHRLEPPGPLPVSGPRRCPGRAQRQPVSAAALGHGRAGPSALFPSWRQFSVQRLKAEQPDVQADFQLLTIQGRGVLSKWLQRPIVVFWGRAKNPSATCLFHICWTEESVSDPPVQEFGHVASEFSQRRCRARCAGLLSGRGRGPCPDMWAPDRRVMVGSGGRLRGALSWLFL